jgi:hypothetical protein
MLDDYPIDDDYIDVENRHPSADVAKTCRVESQESDIDEQVCETCETDDTRQVDDTRQFRATEWQEDDRRHLLADQDGSESTRDRNLLLNAISPTQHDGRALTRTYWQPRDVPAHKQKQYSRLLEYQEGQWDSERDMQRKFADNRRAIDAVCQQLDCTDHQHAVTSEIIESTNLKHMATYSYQHCVVAAVAVATYIADQRDIKGTEKYRELIDAVGSDPKEMRSIRRLLREKSDFL